MGESTEQLEWSLAAERRELGRNLDELEDKAKALKDWRTSYRQRPWAVAGVAFGGAMLVGLMSRSRSTASSALYDEPVSEVQTRRTGFRVPPHLAASADRVKRQAGDTWDRIAEALLGVAAAKAIDFVSHRVPGFGEEYSKRHPEAGGRDY